MGKENQNHGIQIQNKPRNKISQQKDTIFKYNSITNTTGMWQTLAKTMAYHSGKY